MGETTTDDHTPEQLPLDDNDPRWLLLKAAHGRGAERTGDNDLAVIKLTQALAREDGLRCMHLSATGECTLLKHTTWNERRLMLWFGKDGLNVMERRDEFPNHPMRVRGWFFVWQPDLDRIWPPAGRRPIDHADEPLRAIERAKAVLPVIYPPDGNPPRKLTLKAVTKAVAEECERRSWKPPSEDRVHDALEELGYRPPRNRK